MRILGRQGSHTLIKPDSLALPFPMPSPNFHLLIPNHRHEQKSIKTGRPAANAAGGSHGNPDPRPAVFRMVDTYAEPGADE